MIPWYYFVIGGAAFAAASLAIEKFLLKTEHALAFSSSFALTIAALSVFLLPWANFQLSLYQWGVLFMYSVTLSIAYWMSARLFRHGSLSSTAPLYNVLPVVVVVILALIFLGEQLSTAKYGLIAIILLTAFVILSFSNKHREEQYIGSFDRTVVMVALVVGINGAILKYALSTINIFTFMVITSVMTAILLAIAGRERTRNKFDELKEVHKLIMPLGTMALLTIVYRIFLYTAVSAAPISLVSPLNSTLAVFLNTMSGAMFFGEKHIKRKLLLSAIMLIAAYFLVS